MTYWLTQPCQQHFIMILCCINENTFSNVLIWQGNITRKFVKPKPKKYIHKIFIHFKLLMPVLSTVSLTGWETVVVIAATFVAKFCREIVWRLWHNSVLPMFFFFYCNILFFHHICHLIYPRLSCNTHKHLKWYMKLLSRYWPFLLM